LKRSDELFDLHKNRCEIPLRRDNTATGQKMKLLKKIRPEPISKEWIRVHGKARDREKAEHTR
jgi:hypothetical protein